MDFDLLVAIRFSRHTCTEMTVALFDLDGTLTDPKEGLVNCVQYACERLGRPCPPAQELTMFIGPPLRPMFATLFDTSDTELIERGVELYRERYADIGVYETIAYRGVREMLEESALRTSGMYLATSKPTVFAHRIIRHLGFEDYFAGIYGVELDGTFDDKATLLRHLLATEGIPAQTAVMVGDRSADIVAANANGIRSVGALWGYGSEDELRRAGAGRLCANPQDVPLFIHADEQG
jgi:phosphoglycolate phosphatase